MAEFETILVEVVNKVAYATMNRPEKANALNGKLWFEIADLAKWADSTPEVRVLVLQGAGKHFTAGIDFELIMQVMGETAHLPDGHKQEALRGKIIDLQSAFTALENCRKPVIASINGSCIGGGIDLITACDIRYACSDAKFSVKEIDLAIVADIGTLQRLPPIVGEGMARELAMTGRKFDADDAKSMGLVTKIFDDADALKSGVKEIAEQIASKSPLTQRGIKHVMNHCRGKSAAEGLNYVATWNAAMLISADAQEAMAAMMQKRTPEFKD
ncbi:MAG: crotonase/enoyl-CoA hydratase family protein [Deltaproteobacteria bacterium]|nr:crotonase/enoyl-CoA hydratase family protein [Deltaproteobacteria bacterium]